jgi:hypothetical protein
MVRLKVKSSRQEGEGTKPKEEGSTGARSEEKKKYNEGLITCCCGSLQEWESPRQKRKDCREFLLVLVGTAEGARRNEGKERSS